MSKEPLKGGRETQGTPSNGKGNSERFLAAYNQLDEYMRKKLNKDNHESHVNLIQNMVNQGVGAFRQNEWNLKRYATLRNAIVHNPELQKADPLAEPHSHVVDEYETLVEKIQNPPKALNQMAISWDAMYKVDLTTSLQQVVQEMARKRFTHVPVVEEGRLVGVFSESTLFSLFAKEGDMIFDASSTIGDLKEFLLDEGHLSEAFVYLSRKATVFEVKEVFAKEIHQGKRVSVVFLTEKGRKKEKLLGMITPWDAIKKL